MATQKNNNKKATAKKATKKTTKKTTKKPTGKNVNYYEIKLIVLVGLTVLSILGLHTNTIGLVGQFIKNIYFGLFSYAGYALPYIIFLGVFYKINNRLIAYRVKSIIGLVLLFISIIFIVNILNFDILNTNYIEPKVSLFSIDSFKDTYTSGVELLGSGLIGSMIGKLFISLIGRIGLFVVIATLWIISFILLTNINLLEWFKSKFQEGKVSFKENKDIKRQAKEEYLKEAEKLEAARLVEEEKIRKRRELDSNDKTQEKLNKALEKVDKKLKIEEKNQQKALEDYDAMFSQSPTKSVVDKLFKKTAVPTKEEILEASKLPKEEETDKFSMFDSSGYAFDDKFEEQEIIENAPDIFDNHLDSTLSDEDLNIPITGFGTLINDSVKKAYDEYEEENGTEESEEKEAVLEALDQMDFNELKESPTESATVETTEIPEVIEPPKTEFVKPVINANVKDKPDDKKSTFDEAFKKVEQERKHLEVKTTDELFENGIPLSREEKDQVSMFDQITGKKNKTDKVEYEESKVPDEALVQHMSESVRIEFENYRIPDVSLLTKNTTTNKEDKSVAYEKAKQLEEILENFNVDAKVIAISKGPAITRYEIELKPGTKMSKITNLSDDIALNLATQQVRIAAVPGKAAVGIEVPNDSTSIVMLREVLETDAFETSEAKLSVGLGKNIAGTPIIADLGKMPHMLIAGATGSGKSVCVNTLITSILLNAKPDEVKFLMIDPKVVELNTYNGIPHLILPVVTDPKKASVALNWAVQEMTRRYNEFAETGVRDIKGFNKKIGDDRTKFMPQIVVIIDELADLMMVAPNQVEDAICRLAQMARAAGIHLIVATQRPSVDVITGVIKANIPSRVAFAVSSAIDSRTIIDMSGAEKLLGKGDMLYYPVGSSKPQRVQGAFISDEEVESIVNAVKNQFETFTYDENILSNVSASVGASESSDSDDEYLAAAIKLVIEMEQASISMLQRKFKIGYNRAARIVDEMEERGVVGPSLGSKPRAVLISKSELESM